MCPEKNDVITTKTISVPQELWHMTVILGLVTVLSRAAATLNTLNWAVGGWAKNDAHCTNDLVWHTLFVLKHDSYLTS